MDRAERTLIECKRRGLTVARVGKVWHIHGRGVDIRVLRLEDVDLRELNPNSRGKA